MVVPCVISVVNNGSSKTPGRVDAGSSDGDGGQMNQKYCKPNGERSQKLKHKRILELLHEFSYQNQEANRHELLLFLRIIMYNHTIILPRIVVYINVHVITIKFETSTKSIAQLIDGVMCLWC